MNKNVCKFLLIASFSAAVLFTGCGKEQVSLSVWTDTGNVNLVSRRLETFKKLNSKKAVFNFTVIEQNSSRCIDMLVSSHDAQPDVFVFIDNQLNELYRAGYLKEITYNKDKVIEGCGGKETCVVRACTINDKLYAYPELNSNGYFLYYNKKYFKESDLESFEKLADAAAARGKKITMDMHNGWYTYSFFKGAGLDVFRNGKTTNVCNWNAEDTKYTGADVVRAMIELCRNPGFMTNPDTNFISLIESGQIAAGVNGAWNASKVKEIWGEDYSACKLPCITIKGDLVQPVSFAGYKLCGVSAASESPLWAEKVAEFLTNEETQLEIFKNTGECPANLRAANSDIVKASPALSALFEQSKFSHPQFVYRSLWKPAKRLGILITEANPDEIDIQEELDKAVAEIKGR